MDLKTIATNAASTYMAPLLNSSIWSETIARFNTTGVLPTDAATVATWLSTLIGLVMSRSFTIPALRSFIAIIVAVVAYRISDICLTKILALVKNILCVIASLLIFLVIKSLMQDWIV
jgi:hypothetical protein